MHDRKILQIIPATGWSYISEDSDSGEEFSAPLLALALVEEPYTKMDGTKTTIQYTMGVDETGELVDNLGGYVEMVHSTPVSAFIR